jgi:hypothetical protein
MKLGRCLHVDALSSTQLQDVGRFNITFSTKNFLLIVLSVYFNGVTNNEDYVVTTNTKVRIFHHLLCVPEVTLQ